MQYSKKGSNSIRDNPAEKEVSSKNTEAKSETGFCILSPAFLPNGYVPLQVNTLKKDQMANHLVVVSHGSNRDNKQRNVRV